MQVSASSQQLVKDVKVPALGELHTLYSGLPDSCEVLVQVAWSSVNVSYPPSPPLRGFFCACPTRPARNATHAEYDMYSNHKFTVTPSRLICVDEWTAVRQTPQRGQFAATPCARLGHLRGGARGAAQLPEAQGRRPGVRGHRGQHPHRAGRQDQGARRLRPV